MKYRVVLDTRQHYERVIEARDADHAESIMCQDCIPEDIEFCHAKPVKSEPITVTLTAPGGRPVTTTPAGLRRAAEHLRRKA